jgi:3-phenylpropionate/cinnamic acid dioxygenase small subunit
MSGPSGRFQWRFCVFPKDDAAAARRKSATLGRFSMSAPLSLQEMSDRMEIQDVLTRYALAIDAKDWALLDTCFVPDAHLDYTCTGGKKGPYPELRKWLADVLSSFAVTMHFIGNISVRIEGHRAYARTYLWNPMGFGKNEAALEWFAVAAHYVDELVRTDDGWRIRQRVQEHGAMVGVLPGQGR